MTRTTHTEGQWSYVAQESRAIIMDEDGITILEVATPCWANPAEPEVKRIVTCVNAHEDLLHAVEVCLNAERERKKKLLPGAPATTYTQARIDLLEAAIAKAQGGQP